MESSIYNYFAKLFHHLAIWFDNSIIGKIFNLACAFLAKQMRGSMLGKYFAGGLDTKTVWQASFLHKILNYPIRLCKAISARVSGACEAIAKSSGFIKLVDNWELVSVRIYGMAILFFAISHTLFYMILNGPNSLYLMLDICLILFALVLILLNRSLKSLFKGSVILRSVGGLFGEVKKESSKLFFEDKDIALNGTIIAAILGVCCAALSVLLPLGLFVMLVGGVFVSLLVIRYIELGVFLIVCGSPLLPTMALAGLCILCVISLFLKLMTDKTFHLKTNSLTVFVIFFVFAVCYGTLNSFTFVNSAKICLIYLSFVAFYFVLINTVKSFKMWKGLAVSFAIVATLVALYGILQNFIGVSSTQSWVDTNMFTDIKTRVYSTFDNPNVLGEFLVLMIPTSIALLWASKKQGHKMVYAFVFLALCGCLVFTWSRGAWLGVMLAAVLFLLIMDKRWALLGVVAIFMIPLLLGSNSAIASRILSIGNTKDTSTAYRVSIWMASIGLIKDFWMSGIGLGSASFSMIYPRYAMAGANFALHSHNLFLQIWVEMGIIGIIAFFSLILAVLKQSFSLFMYQTRNKYIQTIVIASTAGLLGFLFQGLTDNVWYNYKMLLIFWIIVGFVSSGANIAHEENSKKAG